MGKRTWTSEQEEWLKNNYPTATKEFLMKTLNRNWAAITARANLLHLYRIDAIRYARFSHWNNARALTLDEQKARFIKLLYVLKLAKRKTDMPTDELITNVFFAVNTGKFDLDRLGSE